MDIRKAAIYCRGNDAEFQVGPGIAFRWDMDFLNPVVWKLCLGAKLEGKEDHLLAGKWKGCRVCYIKGDWVLIYQIEDGYLIRKRTGSHSDVF